MFGWDVLAWIGIIAFAMSGAMSAMEEDYDVLGVWIIGLVTSFGGGIMRDVIVLDTRVAVWEHPYLLLLASIACLFVYILPGLWSRYFKMWIFFDAVGLAAFSIQGALIARAMDLPLAAIVAAALLSGCGGGILRDVLTRRKPLLFREEVYAVWSIVAGLTVGLGFTQDDWTLVVLFVTMLVLRWTSVQYQWQLPKRKRGRMS